MTTALCFVAWMYALLSHDNSPPGLAILCGLAWAASFNGW